MPMQLPNDTDPKTARALVFGITDALYFALGTMLVGFFKHNSDFDGTIVVFHENLTQAQQNTLRTIYPYIIFETITQDYVAGHLHVSHTDLLERYSHLYFAKFELPRLLDKFDKVVWMDVDMLVRGPLDHIWDFRHFCWRPTTKYTFDRQQDMYTCFANDITQTALRSPNGGLIGLSQDARAVADVTTQNLYHWFNQFQARVEGTQGDEFAFFMLAAQSKADVTLLPIRYNCPSGTKGAADAQVIHAVGEHKFWNRRALQLAYPDWMIWHKAWISLGGTASEHPIVGSDLIVETPNEIVRCAEFQTLWSTVYEDIWRDLPDDMSPSLRVDRRYWQLFQRQWPKRFLHVKAQKEDNGDIAVGIYLERGAARHPALVQAVTKRMDGAVHLRKERTEIGLAWVQPSDETRLARDVLACARLISGLPYRKTG